MPSKNNLVLLFLSPTNGCRYISQKIEMSDLLAQAIIADKRITIKLEDETFTIGESCEKTVHYNADAQALTINAVLFPVPSQTEEVIKRTWLKVKDW